MTDYNEHGAVKGITQSEYNEARKMALGETKPPLWIQASDIEPKEAHFLRSGIPANNITIIAGDGGVGKSLLECHLAACITTGIVTLFDPEPQNYAEASSYDTGSVLLLNAEDSFAHVISKRLTAAGADMDLITTVNPDCDDKIFIDNELIKEIRKRKPKLVIIDPLQAYIDKGVAMERRNDMRQLLAPLQKCAEEINTAIVIIMHTNKRQSASGRDRLADSADLWDIARSVFIMGNCNDDTKTRYISHEKSSYGQPIQTALCCIDQHGLYKVGETDKKDYDFIHERDRHAGGRPPIKKSDAKEVILSALKACKRPMTARELEEVASQNDVSNWALTKARQELVKDNQIRKTSTGYGGNYQTAYELILAHQISYQ